MPQFFFRILVANENIVKNRELSQSPTKITTKKPTKKL